jgi:hypothetical protein
MISRSIAMSIMYFPILRCGSGLLLLTADPVNICYSKVIQSIECKSVQGVDRNLRNLTVGDYPRIRQYDLSKVDGQRCTICNESVCQRAGSVRQFARRGR